MGIAEQDLMGAAAGLASSGKIVCASTFAMFAAGRAFEVIRNSIGYTHLNVKICATHAGITVGPDGASHQTFEDLALMRTIPGMKKKCYGRKGEDLIIKVPAGTMVIDEETGLLMKDLTEHGDSFVAAKGGKGGKGNFHFKNSVRQAPNFAEAGGEAVERAVILELKLIADVGLVGFPNVGKSTLLSVCTSAKPKIANYHFTTIAPNLGVVSVHGVYPASM